MRVTSEVHPLCGKLLEAIGFKRWKGALLLVVVLPDGSPGTIPANATDVLGVAPSAVTRESALSVEGIRSLRALVSALSPPERSAVRPKTRK